MLECWVDPYYNTPVFHHSNGLYVQPRTRNRITRIGMGMPSSHRSAQPIAPR